MPAEHHSPRLVIMLLPSQLPTLTEAESAQLESLVTYVPIARSKALYRLFFFVAHVILLVFTNIFYVELHFILNYQLFTLWIETITIFIL